MTGLAVVAGYALRESLRRRVFAIVLVLTALFLGLYALGARRAFEEVSAFDEDPVFRAVDATTIAGATLLGLAMFGTLFLSAVLAAFLTHGVVRGDAERGLLQPLVVRPLGRSTLLAARFLAAAAVCALYAAGLFAATAGITHWAGGWWPDRFALPALELAAAAVVVCALGLLGSVFLSATANGIAILMLVGAGIVAGLLGQIGEALDSETLVEVARNASWALPFEALYQDALHSISSRSFGLTGQILQLGPFGGAQSAGAALVPWTLGYLAVAGLAAGLAFARRDL